MQKIISQIFFCYKIILGAFIGCINRIGFGITLRSVWKKAWLFKDSSDNNLPSSMAEFVFFSVFFGMLCQCIIFQFQCVQRDDEWSTKARREVWIVPSRPWWRAACLFAKYDLPWSISGVTLTAGCFNVLSGMHAITLWVSHLASRCWRLWSRIRWNRI